MLHIIAISNYHCRKIKDKTIYISILNSFDLLYIQLLFNNEMNIHRIDCLKSLRQIDIKHARD